MKDEPCFSDLEDLADLFAFEDRAPTTRRVIRANAIARHNLEAEIARIERGYALPKGARNEVY